MHKIVSSDIKRFHTYDDCARIALVEDDVKIPSQLLKPSNLKSTFFDILLNIFLKFKVHHKYSFVCRVGNQVIGKDHQLTFGQIIQAQ